MNAVISVKDLNHYYIQQELSGSLFARIKSGFRQKKTNHISLNGVSFEVQRGMCYGFLGANGAGKTTIIKLLCGVLFPKAGEILVLGENPHLRKKDFLRKIGVLFGNRGQLVWDLAPYDTWDLLAASYNVPDDAAKKRIMNLAERLGIENKMYSPVRKLSLGERMKCELLCAMLHKPELLFLDEPTLGLDLRSQKEIRKLIREEKEAGTTVIITSHYLKDIEETSDAVLLLNEGRVDYDGNIKGLIVRYKPGSVFEASECFSIDGLGSANQLSATKWFLEVQDDIQAILPKLNFENLPHDFSFRKYTLEEAMLGFQEDTFDDEDDE